MTLSQRISLTLFLVILLTGVIFGFIIDRQLTKFSEREHQQFGQSLAQAISQSILGYTIAGNKRKAQEALNRITKNNDSVNYIVIIGFNQEIFATSSKGGVILEFDKADHTHLDEYAFFYKERGSHDVMYVMIENLQAHIHIGLDESRIAKQIEEQQILVSELVLLLVIVGVLIAFYFGKSLSHPVRQLAELLQLFGQNKLQNIPPFQSTDPELCNLHESFVTMVNERRASQELLETSQCELKESNAKLEKSREAAESANQAKSEFLANMSHEMRTPMHAILSFAAMGEKKFDKADREKLQGYFLRVRESGDRLLILLNNLLDLSKLEAGHMKFNLQKQDLKAVVDAAATELNELMQKKSLSLEVEPAEVDTIASFDYDKLLQVMSNLLSNAIKFTPEGKGITVSFEEAELPAGNRYTDTSIVPGISVMVLDEGPGIPEEELEAIFDKFVQSSKTQTGAGGTGLGLAICKDIVEGHGGIIQARNHPDGGAAFVFVIPRQSIRENA